MQPDDLRFLGDFFKALTDRPLEPADPAYVPLYGKEGLLVSDDPMELLARGVEWTPGGGVQLFTGFRGTGKSSELLRLRHLLRERGFLVVLLDIEDHINVSTPLAISDFLLSLAGAFDEALSSAELLGDSALSRPFWDRAWQFLKRIRIDETTLSGGVKDTANAEIKLSLKQDPSFKARLQKHLEGHLTALVQEVHGFFKEAVTALKDKHGVAIEVVLIVDSLEHMRGSSAESSEHVHRSLEELFAGHADKLRLPGLHVIYTIPPYLKVRYPNLGGLYRPGGLLTLPTIKVGTFDRPEEKGLAALQQVLSLRGDCQRLFGEDEAILRSVLRFSGGNFRDLFRFVAELLRRTDTVPVSHHIFDAAFSQMQNEFLPIADDDARWLARVGRTKTAALESAQALPHLARFFDTHMILCYRNGHEWYDLHPLIADEVEEQATALEIEDEG